MPAITSFRGLSGQVIANFLKPAVFLTLIPIFAMYFTILLPFGFLAAFAGPILPIFLSILIYAFLVGRFALPAAQGHLDDGFLTSRLEPMENILFAGRYMFLLVLWGIPFYLAGKYLIEQMIPKLGEAFLSPSFVVELGFVGVLALFFLLLCMVIPVVCFIVATSVSSLGDALSFKVWSWTMFGRTGDLLVLLAAYCGGLSIFFMAYCLPLFVLTLVVGTFSIEGAGYMLFLIYLIPGMASPILLGKLCGAFVSGTDYIGGAHAVPKAEEILADTLGTGSQEQATQEPIAGLREDPPDELVSWVKQELANHSDVLTAYLFITSEMGTEPALTLGVELDQDAKLGSRQSVLKALDPEMRAKWGESGETKVILVNDDSRTRVETVGLRVYRRPGAASSQSE